MLKTIVLFIASTFFFLVDTQKTSCDCRTKIGEFAVTTDGKIIYKGKNAKGQYLYDLSLTFKNEIGCKIFVPSIQFNDNNWIFEPKISLNTDAKNRKKAYRKSIVSETMLKPIMGLDDALFADMLVDYDTGAKACNLSVTIAFQNK
jgi:hypothetical protein